ncbi:MAG: hypothetical protein ACPF8V_05825 [Luteibaculum sp.]
MTKRFISLLFLGLFISCSSVERADYKIEIKLEKNVARLSCETGCNWKHLNFALPVGDSAFVDQIGYSMQANAETTVEKNSFEFVLHRTGENAVELRSIRGNAWEKLSGHKDPELRAWVDSRGILVP